MKEDQKQSRIKHLKEEMHEYYEKLDKSYSRTFIFRTICILITLILVIALILSFSYSW